MKKSQSKHKRLPLKKANKRSGVHVAAPRSVILNNVRTAPELLLKHRLSTWIRQASENKLSSQEHIDQLNDVDGMSAVSESLISLNTTYDFRLAQTAGLVSTSGGVVAYALASDPSSSGQNFAEWIYLTYLFNSFKVLSMQVQFVANVATYTSSNPLVIAGSLSASVAPTSYSSLFDNADSVIWNVARDTTPLGYTHKLKWTGLEYAQTGTPDPGAYAGAPGSIGIYGNGFPVSTVVGSYLVSCIYRFRSRT